MLAYAVHSSGYREVIGLDVGECETEAFWRSFLRTNPLERFNREIGRRTDVVGIFPNDRALIRLAASVVIEQNDEWLVGRRYLSNHSLEAVLDRERIDDTRKETRELTAV